MTTYRNSFMPGVVVFHSRITHLIISHFSVEISFQFIIFFFSGPVSLLVAPTAQLLRCLEPHCWLVQFKVKSPLGRAMAWGAGPFHRVQEQLGHCWGEPESKNLNLNQSYLKLSGIKSNPGSPKVS